MQKRGYYVQSIVFYINSKGGGGGEGGDNVPSEHAPVPT